MPRIERSILINAPVAEVFAYIDDPNNYPQWVPGVVAVAGVIGQGVGRFFRWTYKMAGVTFDGESTYTDYVPTERIVKHSRGGVISIWTYHFNAEGSATRLDVTIEYTIPIPVVGKLVQQLVLGQNQREADLAMANIKARLEA